MITDCNGRCHACEIKKETNMAMVNKLMYGGDYVPNVFIEDIKRKVNLLDRIKCRLFKVHYWRRCTEGTKYCRVCGKTED